MTALELADALKLAGEVDEVARTFPDMAEVSACIRRLAAEVERLKKPLPREELQYLIQETHGAAYTLARAVEAAHGITGDTK